MDSHKSLLRFPPNPWPLLQNSTPPHIPPSALHSYPSPLSPSSSPKSPDSRFGSAAMAPGLLRKPTKRTPLSVEDDGLASIAEMEARFPSGKNTLFSTSFRRRGCSSFRSFSCCYSCPSSSSYFSQSRAASGFAAEETHYFLDSCFLCKKSLGFNRDIFMYRGDKAFCSEICRQKQMDMDMAEEKKRELSMKASSAQEQYQQQLQKSSSNPSNKGDARGLNLWIQTLVTS